MATPEKATDRFRSATEFPKSVEQLNRSEVDQLYIEMRDCLVFTNRSRAQLLRRNEEYKQSALQLRTDVKRLQGLIDQLKHEKQQLAIANQQIVLELENELLSMSSHLDDLSKAFEGVADVESTQSTWGLLAAPNRFFSFLRAVKAIVLWWRDEKGTESSDTRQLSGTISPSLNPHAQDADRRDHPHMHTDPASVGRSLLDK